MRSQEIADLCGVAQTTLYNYERQGYVKPFRNSKGERVWTEADVTKIKKVIENNKKLMLKGGQFSRKFKSRPLYLESVGVKESTAAYIRLLEQQVKSLEDMLHGRRAARLPVEETFEGMCRNSPHQVSHKAITKARQFLLTEPLIWPTPKGGLTLEWGRKSKRDGYYLNVTLSPTGVVEKIET